MTTSDEDRADEAFEEGNRLYEAGDFAGALAAYDRALELRPDHPATLANRASALNQLGRNEEALADNH
ncbi:MAG: tetratricopeptide repeat protein, partial [Chloroflexi bacterium]|nr:tetratricopeptide repeat protein [Chloroflexota bacterium]